MGKKIKLSKNSFTVIPEGEHVFKVTDVEYDEDFGKLEVDMVTAKGQKHTEIFRFVKNDGSENEGAINVFSYFAKTVLQDFSLEEIDPSDLVGGYITCKVEHDVRPHRDDPKKTVTFIRLTDMSPADGFETGESTTETTAKKPVDLDALLG